LNLRKLESIKDSSNYLYILRSDVLKGFTGKPEMVRILFFKVIVSPLG